MHLNIGIDVAKDVHEACILNDKGNRLENISELRISKAVLRSSDNL
jgi:hypothetical protein